MNIPIVVERNLPDYVSELSGELASNPQSGYALWKIRQYYSDWGIELVDPAVKKVFDLLPDNPPEQSESFTNICKQKTS